jgi:hypothetical protein
LRDTNFTNSHEPKKKIHSKNRGSPGFVSRMALVNPVAKKFVTSLSLLEAHIARDRLHFNPKTGVRQA